jgi:uracil-DNA glycosylase
LPKRRTLSRLRTASHGCRGCDLYARATQTVFGEGRVHAPLMLVGEQPGDQEDRAGAPFVGPAGKLLDRALEAAGIRRRDAYVTNAVKHFKWVPRGKRRIHEKPNRGEVDACKPWLESEIDVVGPRVIVCLGATASQAMMGASFRLTKHRGEPLEAPEGRTVVATVHPSSILRITDENERHAAFEAFVRDLAVARETAFPRLRASV